MTAIVYSIQLIWTGRFVQGRKIRATIVFFLEEAKAKNYSRASTKKIQTLEAQKTAKGRRFIFLGVLWAGGRDVLLEKSFGFRARRKRLLAAY